MPDAASCRAAAVAVHRTAQPMTKAQAIAAHPDFPWLSADDTALVDGVLRRARVLGSRDRVLGCSKAGEGNMNLTLRARLSNGGAERSVIVKQSRPWVEKYDFLAAPWDRAISELRFYERVREITPVAARMPRLLGADVEARVLVLEDLGASSDLTAVYTGAPIARETIEELANYLRSLHEGTRGTADPLLANREMRQLNHAHIYEIPLQANNGLELTKIESALVPTADALRADDAYLRLVKETGDQYLADGECLLHGDFFPGSWLAVRDAGVRVIDPEFCFVGDPEFDLGVCAAHFRLANRSWGDVRAFLDAYGHHSAEAKLTARFAACEVMRRLIGYAQLPLLPGPWRSDLLLASRCALLAESLETLWNA
jgi:5-methylthioribose kinase